VATRERISRLNFFSPNPLKSLTGAGFAKSAFSKSLFSKSLNIKIFKMKELDAVFPVCSRILRDGSTAFAGTIMERNLASHKVGYHSEAVDFPRLPINSFKPGRSA
jgi:hypothetical protein